MGFPSPVKDSEEQSLSLDLLCNSRAPSVYLMRYAAGSQREYIKPNSYLVIDSAAKPTSGSLIVATIDGEFTFRRYVVAVGVVRLEQLDSPTKVRISSDESLFDGDWPQFFGVITQTISPFNDKKWVVKILVALYKYYLLVLFSCLINRSLTISYRNLHNPNIKLELSYCSLD